MLVVIKGLPETYTKTYWTQNFNRYPGFRGIKCVPMDLENWLDKDYYTRLTTWWSFPTASLHCAYEVSDGEEYWTLEFLRPDVQFSFRNTKLTDLIKEVKEFIDMCCPTLVPCPYCHPIN